MNELSQTELCFECGQSYICRPDPRIPPLDVADCLCAICFEAAIEEVIDELKDQLSFYEELRNR